MSCNSFRNLKIREQIYMNEVCFELDLKIFTTGLRRNILIRGSEGSRRKQLETRHVFAVALF